jgi:purine-nucleoside phosphorylase
MEILHNLTTIYHSITHLQHTLGSARDEMATSASVFQRATETAEFLRDGLPAHLARPRVAIVCGSGLGGLAKTVNRGDEDATVTWEYKDVPHFPLSTGE